MKNIRCHCRPCHSPFWYRQMRLCFIFWTYFFSRCSVYNRKISICRTAVKPKSLFKKWPKKKITHHVWSKQPKWVLSFTIEHAICYQRNAISVQRPIQIFHLAQIVDFPRPSRKGMCKCNVKLLRLSSVFCSRVVWAGAGNLVFIILCEIDLVKQNHFTVELRPWLLLKQIHKFTCVLGLFSMSLEREMVTWMLAGTRFA